VHIVVMGCGRVGSSLARNLERAGHSVAIIDQNPAAFRRLGPEFAGDQVTGVGFDRETLHRAGIGRAGAFAAVSSGDNSNIIAARVARETFGVAHVVARIYDPKRAEVYERLGIPTVATVPWTVHRFLSALLGDKHVEDWRDPSGAVSLVQVALHESWVGQKVKALEAATEARVAFVTRFGRGMLPTGGTMLQDGDQVHLLVTDDIADAVERVAGAAPTIEGHH
jgi:trk/ktr system potassium uptake protein